MTHDDSVQIAATSPARRRAFARMGRAERASGRDGIGGEIYAEIFRPPSLESSQNAEEISTQCGFLNSPNCSRAR